MAEATTPARVLVVEHEPACPAGHLGTWLEEAGAQLAPWRPWAGEPTPALEQYAAQLVLGGSMGAHDDATTPWLGPVKEMVRDAHGRGVPTLGVCLGHQLIAVALGGDVAVNPRGQQVGLFDVGWTPDADDDALFGPLASPRRGVQWNNDVVTALPDGAVAIAATDQGELQAARFGPSMWGVQLHPEVDVAILESWAAGDRDDHERLGIDQGAVLRTIDAARDELDAAWRPLGLRFAELAATRTGLR